MYEKILAPIDGSRASSQSLRHVRAIAEKFGSHVILIRVADAASPVMMADAATASASVAELAMEAAEAETAHNLTQARRHLNSNKRSLEKRGISTETLVPIGSADEEIISAAKKNKVDIIVMSTRGHSGVRRAILGSVADAVVRADIAPVLLVKQ